MTTINLLDPPGWNMPDLPPWQRRHPDDVNAEDVPVLAVAPSFLDECSCPEDCPRDHANE